MKFTEVTETKYLSESFDKMVDNYRRKTYSDELSYVKKVLESRFIDLSEYEAIDYFLGNRKPRDLYVLAKHRKEQEIYELVYDESGKQIKQEKQNCVSGAYIRGWCHVEPYRIEYRITETGDHLVFIESLDGIRGYSIPINQIHRHFVDPKNSISSKIIVVSRDLAFLAIHDHDTKSVLIYAIDLTAILTNDLIEPELIETIVDCDISDGFVKAKSGDCVCFVWTNVYKNKTKALVIRFNKKGQR